MWGSIIIIITTRHLSKLHLAPVPGSVVASAPGSVAAVLTSSHGKVHLLWDFPHLQKLFHAGCQQGAPRAGFRWGGSEGGDGRQHLLVGRFVITALVLVVKEGMGWPNSTTKAACIHHSWACPQFLACGRSLGSLGKQVVPSWQLKPRQELISHRMTQESSRSVSFFIFFFFKPFCLVDPFMDWH